MGFLHLLPIVYRRLFQQRILFDKGLNISYTNSLFFSTCITYNALLAVATVCSLVGIYKLSERRIFWLVLVTW